MDVDFSFNLKSGNAAFVDDPRGEVCRLLRQAADKIESGSDCGPLYDYNGRPAGNFALTIDRPAITCPECGEEPHRQNPAGEWLCDHCGHAWEGGAE